MIHSRWEHHSWKHFGWHRCSETWSVIWNYNSFFLSSLSNWLMFLIVEFDGYALTGDTAGHYFYRLSAIVFLIQSIEESTTRLILLDSRKFGMPHWMKFRRENMHPSSTECKVNVSMIIIRSSKVCIRDLHMHTVLVTRDSFWNLITGQMSWWGISLHGCHITLLEIPGIHRSLLQKAWWNHECG